MQIRTTDCITREDIAQIHEARAKIESRSEDASLESVGRMLQQASDIRFTESLPLMWRRRHR